MNVRFWRSRWAFTRFCRVTVAVIVFRTSDISSLIIYIIFWFLKVPVVRVLSGRVVDLKARSHQATERNSFVLFRRVFQCEQLRLRRDVTSFHHAVFLNSTSRQIVHTNKRDGTGSNWMELISEMFRTRRLDEKLTKSAVRQLPRIADPFTPKHRPATAGDRMERNCSVASCCLVWTALGLWRFPWFRVKS
jgi:hypothetical protein